MTKYRGFNIQFLSDWGICGSFWLFSGVILAYFDIAFDQEKLHQNEELEIGVPSTYIANHHHKQRAACVDS